MRGLSLLLFVTRMAHAAVLNVDPDDASAYETIEDAIAAASSGDEIQLADAEHTTCATIDGLALTITSATAKPARVTGSDGCEAMLRIENGAELDLSNVTMQ